MENVDTASVFAYREIRKMISSGKLKPGEKVSQLGLSKDLGISTVPITEAMRLLESEGLLVKDGRRMARVRKLSPCEVEGLYLVREGLESVAARLCARKITFEQIERLKTLLNAFETAVDCTNEEEFNMLEIEIHRCIAANADCSLLSEELNRTLLIESTAAEKRPLKDLNKYRRSHRALVEAIVDHDEELAEYIMKRHIQNGLREYLDLDK
ncbi:MAG: GntR family transcriptional regulator [Sedimentisphaerales bacterium]